MNHGSRFSALSRAQAIIAICVLLMIIGAGFIKQASQGTPGSPVSAKPQIADADLLLYRTVNARVAQGENYYQVSAEELRLGNYPLKPFVTFRLPTLAYILASLGPVASIGLLWALTVIMLSAWWRLLDNAFDDPGRRITGIMLIGTGSAIVVQTQYVVMHELWAGLLIALAAALRQLHRWWWALTFAAAALIIRELALPFVLLLATFALFEKRVKEWAAYTALVCVFGIVIWVHAEQVAAVVRASDPASPGWLSIGGWQGFLRAMRLTSAIRVLPEWIGNITIILAFFGWISWRTTTGLFCTLLLAGYGIIFMVLGRPDNFYWGLIVAPLLLLGLAFLPRAVDDLRGAIMRSS